MNICLQHFFTVSFCFANDGSAQGKDPKIIQLKMHHEPPKLSVCSSLYNNVPLKTGIAAFQLCSRFVFQNSTMCLRVMCVSAVGLAEIGQNGPKSQKRSRTVVTPISQKCAKKTL